MKKILVGVYDEETSALRGGGFSIKSCILENIFRLSDDDIEFVRVGWRVDPDLKECRQVTLSLPRWRIGIHSLRNKARWLLKPGAVIRQLFSPAPGGGGALRCSPDQELLLAEEEALEGQIARAGIDLMLFLEPGEVFGGRLPYISYVWDIAHRIQPFFPEVNNRKEWERVERVKGKAMERAFRVICGTETGRQQVVSSYALPVGRVAVNPFPVAKYPDLAVPDTLSALAARAGLGKGDPAPFFFYPANFWPHKNHVVLLEALSLLTRRGVKSRVVFSGADKGNLAYLHTEAARLGVESAVGWAGFVSRSELSWLYAHATAMVFPTLIGPDNLPPLEAMAHGCAVVASDIEGAREQLGDAALYFPPFSASALADLLGEILSTPEKTAAVRERASRWIAARTPAMHAERLREICREFQPYARLSDWNTLLRVK